MSYMLLDRAGYIGDLASTAGLEQLRSRANGKPSFKSFLDTGTLDRENVEKVLSELERDPKLNYLRVLIEGGEAPFIISDGMAEEGVELEVELRFEAQEKALAELEKKVRQSESQKVQVEVAMVKPPSQKTIIPKRNEEGAITEYTVIENSPAP